MNTPTRFLVTIVLVFATVMVVRHGLDALAPALPKDMPGDSQFLQSGYDLARNEPQGTWVVCRPDVAEAADFCRVTDQHGEVIFQGDFLPVSDRRVVRRGTLRVAAADMNHLWVRGPVEGGPVPVIPLTSGELLVPEADSIALANRWAKDPDELARLELK